jgi:uncharacterized protein YdiU (UPF0061 family)
MGLFFSKLLNKLGLLSDQDLVEEILEDAKRQIKQAEADIDRVAADTSNPNYKNDMEQASNALAEAYKKPREFMNSIKDTKILSAIQKKRRTMKKSSPRRSPPRSPRRSHSPHRSHSPRRSPPRSHSPHRSHSPPRSHGGHTKKRARHARYSRRAR